MASKVKKGFLYYIAWILFIALGLCCVLATILIFNPGKDVLGIGIRYVNHSNVEKVNKISVAETQTTISSLNLSSINITTGFTDVEVIRSSEYEQITFIIDKKVVGFSQTENVNYNVKFTLDGSTLNVLTNEPDLWLKLSPQAKITLHCPKEKSFGEILFNIKTDSGSISISHSDYGLAMNQLNIETTSGSIYLAQKANFTNGNVNIKSQSSTIDIYSDITNTLKLETNSSKVFIKSISGNLNLSAVESKIKATKILGNVFYSSQKGYIYIDELGNLTTKTNGNFTAEADKTHIANVVIEKMSGNLTIPTGDKSDIVVNEIYGEILVNTTSGKVDIKKSYSTTSVYITTLSGSIWINQLEKTNITATSSTAEIHINFLVIGVATITTDSADIYIGLKLNTPAKINYNTKNGLFASWITTALDTAGTLLAPETPENTTSVLNLTTKTKGAVAVNNNFTI